MTEREKLIKAFHDAKALVWFEDDVYDIYTAGYNNGIETGKNIALAILKEQEPKTPIHIHEEYPEHDWETDEDGKIDEWAMSYEYHNGPMCKRCYHSFCIHCEPNGWNDKPCVIDYYQCPKCRKHIFKNSKNIEYCVNCGQAVKWDS
jgi:hypothetical protein